MDTANFLLKVRSKQLRIGIIGLGYVGLPLMLTCIRKGFRVIGFDTDDTKVQKLMAGESYIKHVPSGPIRKALDSKMFFATGNFEHRKKCDALIICVPTPLNANREPNMRYVLDTATSIAPPKDQLVVLESTTYPGTTDGVLRETLERGGNVAGKDFHLAFSPEREDPGNKNFSTQNIPKIVGGLTPECKVAAESLYGAILDKVVAVSSTRVAEMAKLLENIFRSVNIALVNELKMLCDAMGMDVWEVIDAAASKPFGFMPFYPGPGLGGHCIPVDPFYLSWKAREYDLTTRFIELAGEINTSMHHYVLDRIIEALNGHGKAVSRSTILIVGIAYKNDIDDMRESPALPIMDMLLSKGATVRYYDPFIPKLHASREFDLQAKYPHRFSDVCAGEEYEGYDVVVIVAAHSAIDYPKLVEKAQLVVDCRNATRRVTNPSLRDKIVKA